MQFVGELSEKELRKVSECNVKLHDPARLQALKNTGLMDTPKEAAFDRLANLAAKILKVPLTIVSLVNEEKQFFKAAYGLPSPFDETRTLPIDFSLCRYTMAGDSIISSNTANDSFLQCHPSTGPWGIGALIVLPLITIDGHVLGTFCAIDPNPRDWTELEMEVMVELTASVMAEINLRDQIAKLKTEQNLRDTFVAALTHDLRTPLTASMLSAQLLARKFTQPEIVSSVSKITDSLNRADNMIQNLLDANMIKAGSKIPLKIEECNINSIINSTLQEMQSMYKNKFILSASEETIIHADPDGFRRIFENLVTNAVKYGAPETEIRLTLNMEAGLIRFLVTNMGEPIPEEDMINIFEVFHRTVSATQGTQKGWGLGLPLVRGLAEAHGGKVSVTSTREQGTCFVVELPVQH